MNIAKVIQRRIRRSGGGVQVDGDVHAVVAANVGERGQVTHVSSTQQASTDSGSTKSSSEGSKPA